MKTTVIIPTLNEEKRIQSCIQAVKEQAAGTEILVVDGGSTDNTVHIAEQLGARVVIETTKTVSAGRDKGLHEATGDIVIFIDADCLPETDWFSQLIKPFSDQTVMGVGGRVHPIDGTITERIGLHLVFNLAAPLFFAFQTPMISGQIMAFRRQQAIDAGGFNPKQIHGEDTSMFLAIKDYGRIVHSPATVRADMRRIRKWGLLKYLSFNLRNFISLLRYKRPIDDAYEPIREYDHK